MNLIRLGLTNGFRGLREGDSSLLLVGIVLAFLGWRRSRTPKRKQLHSVKLNPGDTVTLRLTEKGAVPLDV